jgi:hypothetical protein
MATNRQPRTATAGLKAEANEAAEILAADAIAEFVDMLEARKPTTGDAVTWMLDLDEHGRPWRAHMIVEDDRTTRTTACGKRVTAGTHPRGWWSFPPGELPLSGPNDIHCGWTPEDVAAHRAAKGWSP